MFACDVERENDLDTTSRLQDSDERNEPAERLQEGEAYYRTLIAHRTDGIMLITLDGTIKYASPSWV